jgi:CRISPR-associated protein Cmr4
LLDKAEALLQVIPPPDFSAAEWSRISSRLALVSDRLFGHVVNSNMEVRTSVSINPGTGAAEEGALFSYEAVPRGSVFTLELLEDDYRKSFPVAPEPPWNSPSSVAVSGLGMARWLGIGGMGTRGFGRIGMLGEPWTVRT